MLNEQDIQGPLNAEQHRFVEDMGQVIASFGVPRTSGRVYAYLLLSPGPATLDDMVAELGVSKSGASVAARQLTSWGMARRLGQRGSRRVLYEPLVTADAIYAARATASRTLVDTIRRGAQATANPAVRSRLESLVAQFEMMLDELLDAVRRAAARRDQ